MKEFTAEKLQELENDREFAAKMEEAKNPQDVMAIMKEYGIEMTAENGEMSEDALDNIAGGGKLWDWFMSWFDRRSKKNTEDLNNILKKVK